METSPCIKCRQPYFLFYNQNPKTVVCSRCYIPNNPTTGWMVSEYRRRKLDEKALSAIMHASQSADKVEKFLHRALNIDVAKIKKVNIKDDVNR